MNAKSKSTNNHLIKQNIFLNSISKNDFFTNHKRVLLKFKRKYTNLTKTFLPISFIKKSIAQSTLDEYRGRTSRIALALYTLKHPGEHNTDPYTWLAAYKMKIDVTQLWTVSKWFPNKTTNANLGLCQSNIYDKAFLRNQLTASSRYFHKMLHHTCLARRSIRLWVLNLFLFALSGRIRIHWKNTLSI